MKTKIIPQIKDIKLGSATLSLCDFAIADEIKELLPIADEIFKDNKKAIAKYKITLEDAFIDYEQYRISVKSDHIIIKVKKNDNRALMYALFTLSELALLNDDVLTECEISDSPALEFRALSDDISRGQISTTQDFFDIIKKLARYKYNTYMPYMEDVFKFASIKGWGKYSDPVEKEEWLTIIDYAKKYNITVRPIVNLLGHFDKMAWIDELRPLSLILEDGTVTHCMDPKKPQVREVIVQILDEVIEVFGKGIIHVGGDEPVDLTKAYGVEQGGSLFIEHYTFIANELKKRDCTCMLYADFFAPPWGDYAAPIDRAKELPSDVQFVFWDYALRPAYPFVDSLHEQNLQLYISPGSWAWKRFACDFKTCFKNVQGLLKADNGRSLGMIMSSWADGGDTLRESAWGGILIGANYCWAPASTYSYEEIYTIYHQTFFGISEQQAMLLDNIYHYDYLVKREHEHEFKYSMFKDPFIPISYSDKENVNLVQNAMIKAKSDMETIIPLRNHTAFDALKLGVARTLYTANKIVTMPHRAVETIEEGIPYSVAAKKLAAELLLVKDMHKRMWFANNRASEWEMCECRYDDEYDRLNMFARNVRLRKFFITAE